MPGSRNNTPSNNKSKSKKPSSSAAASKSNTPKERTRNNEPTVDTTTAAASSASSTAAPATTTTRPRGLTLPPPSNNTNTTAPDYTSTDPMNQNFPMTPGTTNSHIPISRNNTFTNTLRMNLRQLHHVGSFAALNAFTDSITTTGTPIYPHQQNNNNNNNTHHHHPENNTNNTNNTNNDSNNNNQHLRVPSSTSGEHNNTNENNNNSNNNLSASATTQRYPPSPSEGEGMGNRVPTPASALNVGNFHRFPTFEDNISSSNTNHPLLGTHIRNLSFAHAPRTTFNRETAGGIPEGSDRRDGSPDDDDDPELSEAENLRMRRQETVNFARTAVEDYGYLDPMELAMLQAEQGSTATDEEQISAAEILAAIELLNEKEFALLSEATNKQMNDGLANTLMYNGSAWYLPQISECRDDEPQNEISWSMDEGLTIALCGSRATINLISIFIRILTLVVIWWMLWLALPKSLLEPGGYVFDPVVCFLVCSVVGGILGRIFGIPPLVFILGFSILWANVGDFPGALTQGIVKDVRSIISKTGLTIILLRSGLSMSWNTIKPAASNILTMAFVPMLAEVVVHGFMAKALIDYGGSSLWPFLQSMMAAPAASAVVGATTLLMRTWGYGTTRGPGVILLPSVVLDMVLGVWGINFVVALVFRDENTSLAWTIGQGPLQIVVGPVIGIIFGFIWYGMLHIIFREAKVLPHGKYSRAFIRRSARVALFVFTALGLLQVFFGYKYNIAGGGGLACTMMAATAQYLMTQEDSPEHFKIVKGKMYANLTGLWDLLIMPALFSVAASSIQTSSMFAPEFFGKAIACIVVGVVARVATCVVCSWTYDMTPSERVIAVIASAGRATVQVALGPLAAEQVASLPGNNPELEKYAAQVYDASIIGVLLMTPISVVLLTRVAPIFWLTDAQHEKLKRKAAREERRKKRQEAIDRGETLAAHLDDDGGSEHTDYETDLSENYADQEDEEMNATPHNKSSPDQVSTQREGSRQPSRQPSRPPSTLRRGGVGDNNNLFSSSVQPQQAAPFQQQQQFAQSSRPPSRLRPKAHGRGAITPPSHHDSHHPHHNENNSGSNPPSRPPSRGPLEANSHRPPSRLRAAERDEAEEKRQGSVLRVRQAAALVQSQREGSRPPSALRQSTRLPQKSPLAREAYNRSTKPNRTPLARDAFSRPQRNIDYENNASEEISPSPAAAMNTKKVDKFDDWDVPMYESESRSRDRVTRQRSNSGTSKYRQKSPGGHPDEYEQITITEASPKASLKKTGSTEANFKENNENNKNDNNNGNNNSIHKDDEIFDEKSPAEITEDTSAIASRAAALVESGHFESARTPNENEEEELHEAVKRDANKEITRRFGRSNSQVKAASPKKPLSPNDEEEQE